MTKKIVVLGALSDIAEAMCRLYAAEGADLVISGRNLDRLSEVSEDLRIRGAGKVVTEALDLASADPEALISKWSTELDGIDVVLLAYGVLGEQRGLEHDLDAAARLIDTNFRSAALWSMAAANHFEAARSGSLVVIGSVAGDLPRALLALRGRTREQLPNGAHVALYKDALYANLELARQLTGAMRLVFASDGFTMHVQLVRGLDTVPGFERSLLNELAADARPSRVVAWPYARFPFGMGLDYERKFAYFVPGDPHR